MAAGALSQQAADRLKAAGALAGNAADNPIAQYSSRWGLKAPPTCWLWEAIALSVVMPLCLYSKGAVDGTCVRVFGTERIWGVFGTL